MLQTENINAHPNFPIWFYQPLKGGVRCFFFCFFFLLNFAVRPVRQLKSFFFFLNFLGNQTDSGRFKLLVLLGEMLDAQMDLFYFYCIC